MILANVSTATRAQFLLKDQFPNLSFNSPVGFYCLNDTTSRLCVIEQAGVIRIFPNDSSATATKAFLDISAKVVSGGELGLLGLAFHPHYATNGFLYVDYTRDNPLRTVISRFSVSSSNPDSADPSSEVVLLEQSQPFDNHNGGQLAFGPDGYLYIAFGDGGSAGDPFGNGQKKTTLLGKILRINVDSTVGLQQYAIPADNPFFGDGTKKQEIFAYGLRNPWRFSFDRQTLWCGDVGQDTWEEVDTVISGGDYGWNIMEASHCFNPPSSCNTNGLILPIWEYMHQDGRCSITGGFVYRGSQMPLLRGKYIYGDYCTGEIWALTPVPSSLPTNAFLVGAGSNISSFGVDSSQELYVCNIGAGKIYKLMGQPPEPCTLVVPPDSAIEQPDILNCAWTSSVGASAYHLQVAFDSLFTSLAVNDSTILDTVRRVGPLADTTLFYWRVRARNEAGWSMFTSFRRFSTRLSSIHIQVMKSWNLLSLPIDVADGRRSTLFPSAISNAFMYNPAVGYEPHDTLIPRVGFWLEFDDSETIGLVGTSRYVDTVDVVAGWNMIGSLSQSFSTTQVTSIPGGVVTSQFFRYEGNYTTSSTIDPGVGYWVKVDQDGRLVLSSLSAISANGSIHIVPTSEVPPAPPKRNVTSSHDAPKEYSLEQIFPNPFNLSATVRYRLPVESRVSLKILNMLGQVVKMLSDEIQEPGYKQVEWEANGVASGMYFCTLQAVSVTDPSKAFIETKKFVLLK